MTQPPFNNPRHRRPELDAATEDMRRPSYPPPPAPQPSAPEKPDSKRSRLVLFSVLGLVGALGILLAVVLLTTGSGTPPICTALEDGKGALIGTREVYGSAGTTENGIRILTEAAVTVRAECPEFADEASQMDGLVSLLRINEAFNP